MRNLNAAALALSMSLAGNGCSGEKPTGNSAEIEHIGVQTQALVNSYGQLQSAPFSDPNAGDAYPSFISGNGNYNHKILFTSDRSKPTSPDIFSTKFDGVNYSTPQPVIGLNDPAVDEEFSLGCMPQDGCPTPKILFNSDAGGMPKLRVRDYIEGDNVNPDSAPANTEVVLGNNINTPGTYFNPSAIHNGYIYGGWNPNFNYNIARFKVAEMLNNPKPELINGAKDPNLDQTHMSFNGDGTVLLTTSPDGGVHEKVSECEFDEVNVAVQNCQDAPSMDGSQEAEGDASHIAGTNLVVLDARILGSKAQIKFVTFTPPQPDGGAGGKAPDAGAGGKGGAGGVAPDGGAAGAGGAAIDAGAAGAGGQSPDGGAAGAGGAALDGGKGGQGGAGGGADAGTGGNSPDAGGNGQGGSPAGGQGQGAGGEGLGGSTTTNPGECFAIATPSDQEKDLDNPACNGDSTSFHGQIDLKNGPVTVTWTRGGLEQSITCKPGASNNGEIFVKLDANDTPVKTTNGISCGIKEDPKIAQKVKYESAVPGQQKGMFLGLEDTEMFNDFSRFSVPDKGIWIADVKMTTGRAHMYKPDGTSPINIMTKDGQSLGNGLDAANAATKEALVDYSNFTASTPDQTAKQPDQQPPPPPEDKGGCEIANPVDAHTNAFGSALLLAAGVLLARRRQQAAARQ